MRACQQGRQGQGLRPGRDGGAQAAACAYGAYGMLLLVCLEGEFGNFEEACAGGAGRGGAAQG